MSDIVIRQLGADDWQLFRDMRLLALRSDPNVFTTTYEKESERTDDTWKRFLTNSDTAIFGIFDANEQIGITAIGIDWNDTSRTRALLWGSWLKPEYRGKGISQSMYKARLEWAYAHPTCKKVIVSHLMDNLHSKNANQKHGFVYTHTETRRRRQQPNIQIVYYELHLNKPELNHDPQTLP